MSVAQETTPLAAPGGTWEPLTGLRCVYQPLIELSTGEVLGYEALARGQAGTPWERPDNLFAAARRENRVCELDLACRAAALEGALHGGLLEGIALFINVEPVALREEPTGRLAELFREAALRKLSLVIEVTERSLTSEPAELLRMARRVRAAGWGIAVDDVGAVRDSLAIMPFLQPDVIKLDLTLVQRRTTVAVAEIVNAVNAQVSRTGAIVLAEGIETEEHRRLAEAMGARIGQGWLFGRPGPLPAALTPPKHPLRLLSAAAALPEVATPWELVKFDPDVRRSTKPLLVAMSKHLERQALAGGAPAVLTGAFQQRRYITPSTKRRYAALAKSAALVAAFGENVEPNPVTGVRGQALATADPLVEEWTIAVVTPHFAGALIAHDVGDALPETERRFDYVITYERQLVLAAAASMLSRLEPPEPTEGRQAEGDQAGEEQAGEAQFGEEKFGEAQFGEERSGATHRSSDHGHSRDLNRAVQQLMDIGDEDSALDNVTILLARAVGASASGIVIVDALGADRPIVYANRAFELLSGYPAAEIVGRNCRFLQGPGTDPEAKQLMTEMLDGGLEVRTTVRNYRADGTEFWNDLSITPVTGADGVVTHFIGTQTDVSERVRAEMQVQHLAYHDALTGLANMAQATEYLDAELGRAARVNSSVAVISIDLGGLRRINEDHGRQVGDSLLVAVAAKLREVIPSDDLTARVGPDDFLIVACRSADEVVFAAMALVASVEQALRTTFEFGSVTVSSNPTLGAAVYPADGATSEMLLATAERSRKLRRLSSTNRL